MPQKLDASEQRWHTLLMAWQCAPNTDLYRALRAAYAQPHRHYHHFAHIVACLSHLDRLREICHYPEEVEMALWFHDAVYAIMSSTNEEDSATWAQTFLRQQQVPEDKIKRVVDMILLTKAHAVTEDRDGRILLDIDLAILGEVRAVFQGYERAIRAEYAAVPTGLFKWKRKAILQGFLAQEWLYATAAFRDSHEATARDNLVWAIAQL